MDMQEIANNYRIDDLMAIQADTDVKFDDDYQLKLSTKRLRSGKCQVKFYATVNEQKDLYGYVLVDAGKTLRDVVVKIKEKLRTIRCTRDFHHLHLYSIEKSGQDDLNFIIFDS